MTGIVKESNDGLLSLSKEAEVDLEKVHYRQHLKWMKLELLLVKKGIISRKELDEITPEVDDEDKKRWKKAGLVRE